MRSSKHTALFLLLSVVWGVSFVAIKAGLDYFPPVVFAALRYDVAGLLLVGYALAAADRPLPRTRADLAAVLVSGVLMIAGYNGLLFVGERGTTGAVAAIIVSLSPLLTTGFARALLPSERLSPAGVGGVLLGLAGVGIVARPDPANLLSGDLASMGLILLAAASSALGSVLLGRVPSDISTEGLVAWSMLVGALVMHAAALALPGESLAAIRWTPTALLALAYLALVASAFAYLVYFDLLGRWGPIRINLISYVIPVFAALAGWLLLDETVDALTVAGFGVVLLGFALVKRDELRRLLRRAEWSQNV